MLDADGRPVARGQRRRPRRRAGRTSRVAEFNDLDGLDRELAHGDVAAVLMEPALTNIGIVLPEPGYLEGVRELTRAHGTLLINDETHTFSAGPGGCTAAWGLEPDVVTIGKAIAGGIPPAPTGSRPTLADRLCGATDLDLIDMGGVGGTLAGNALSMAAMRATPRRGAHRRGVRRNDRRWPPGSPTASGTTIDAAGLPWSVAQLGARAEYRFAAPAPRNGTQSAAAADDELDDFLHVFLHNRGVLLTPFHNMALMCPATTEPMSTATEVFGDAVAELVG